MFVGYFVNVLICPRFAMIKVFSLNFREIFYKYRRNGEAPMRKD